MLLQGLILVGLCPIDPPADPAHRLFKDPVEWLFAKGTPEFGNISYAQSHRWFHKGPAPGACVRLWFSYSEPALSHNPLQVPTAVHSLCALAARGPHIMVGAAPFHALPPLRLLPRRRARHHQLRELVAQTDTSQASRRRLAHEHDRRRHLRHR